MSRTRRISIFLLAALVPACQPPDADSRVGDAADLAEKRTGRRPAWDQSWDDAGFHADDGETLSLDRAVALALRANRDLRADIEAIGQADADLLQAGLMQNPVFSFMIMFPSGGGRTMLRGNSLPMQPIQDLWLIPARKKVAAAALRETVLRVADRGVETVADVKKNYAGIQFAQRAVELIQQNMSLVEQSTGIIQISQSAGKANQVEASLSRIRHERLRSDLFAMQTMLQTAKHQMLMNLGSADAKSSWVVTPPDDDLPTSLRTLDETDLILLAAENRLDLKSMEWQTESALRRITLAKREGWPDLAVGFTFERSPRGRTRGASSRALAADAAAQGFVDGLNQTMPPPTVGQIAPLPRPTREVKYTLGPMIQFELPIFDWGQAQTAKAIHEYEQRRAAYDAKLQGVVQSVRDTLVRLDEADRQFALFKDVILPEVERNLELARESYVAGQTNLTIYLQAQEDVISTRIRMLEFLRNLRVLEAELERAVGGEQVLADLLRRSDQSATQATSPCTPESQPDDSNPEEVNHER